MNSQREEKHWRILGLAGSRGALTGPHSRMNRMGTLDLPCWAVLLPTLSDTLGKPPEPSTLVTHSQNELCVQFSELMGQISSVALLLCQHRCSACLYLPQEKAGGKLCGAKIGYVI